MTDGDHTQPMETGKTVNFRCTCGRSLLLDINLGGKCHNCLREIPAHVLNHELSRTTTLGFATEDHHSEFTLPLLKQDQELIGKSLGHFEIVSVLGSGGMGQVFRALDKSLQRYVAVKVLNRSATGNPKEIERLLQEAVAQARVNHPNIVAIYFVGEQDGDPFLAMELVPGQTLTTRMQEGPLSFFEIVSIGWQITEALRISYELDIIHGDIKPSNILLQENGVAKLGDFGMARSASTENAEALGGTPNYLAPEIFDGEKGSVQSDMYALGVTLYEMSFGRRPITLSGNTLSEWAKSHDDSELTFPQPWPESYPESWRHVLSRLLARRPEDRYSTYEELAAALIKVAPAQNMPARVLPRVIAASIDYSIVLLLFLGAEVLNILSSIWVSNSFHFDGIGWLSFWDQNVPWYWDITWIAFKLALAMICFLPIVIYTLASGYWRQSIGRALMHIRVINEHGLRPTRRVFMGRSVLRMAGVWATISLGTLPLEYYSEYMFPAVALSIVLFMLADLAYMVFFGNGTSLHDRWYRTRVVIDADQQ